MVSVVNDSFTHSPAEAQVAQNTMSKPLSSLQVMKATIIKDLIILKRYQANLIGGIIEISIMVGTFFLFSQVIDFRDAGIFKDGGVENGMFLFFLAGIVIMLFQNTALFMPVNSVRRDLYNGTLETLWSMPNSNYAYLLGSVVADAIIRMIFVVPMIILLLVVSGPTAEILPLLLAIFVFLMTIASIGVLISCMAILWKQVGNLVGIIQILTQFIGGAFLPVQSFPVYLQWISYLFPFTYAYDLVRYYAFGGNWIPILPLYVEWAILAGNVLLYYLISKSMLRKATKHAKNKGLHLI